ncbi:MAG: hypothetical protein HZC55_06155 [Verrucomicrobia bacterium]|nr:hypothetical protein [Verrucomicrobiota bacterium]
MTISTIRIEHRLRVFRRRRPTDGLAGFSLTELIVGASLSGFVLAGVLAAFLLLGRSGVRAANYSASDTEVRRALEIFTRDVRMASDLLSQGGTVVTFTLPAPNAFSGLPAPDTNKVTYGFDGTRGTFYRLPGGAASTATRHSLVRGVTAVAFSRFNRLDHPASSDAETKRLQVALNVRLSQGATAASSTPLVTASSILRNKVAQ